MTDKMKKDEDFAISLLVPSVLRNELGSNHRLNITCHWQFVILGYVEMCWIWFVKWRNGVYLSKWWIICVKCTANIFCLGLLRIVKRRPILYSWQSWILPKLRFRISNFTAIAKTSQYLHYETIVRCDKFTGSSGYDIILSCIYCSLSMCCYYNIISLYFILRFFFVAFFSFFLFKQRFSAGPRIEKMAYYTCIDKSKVGVNGLL